MKNRTNGLPLTSRFSRGIFKIAKKSQVEIGLEEYRKGKYTVINKGKREVSNE